MSDSGAIDGVPPDDCVEQVEDLREQVLDLREQVQFLRAALVSREPRRVDVVRVLRARANWFERRLASSRRLAIGAERVIGSVDRGRSRRAIAVANDHVGFRPYAVRAVRRPRGPDAPLVLHAIAHLGTGGSARLVVDLVEQLSGGFEHAIITARPGHVPGYTGLDVQCLDRGPDSVQAFLRARKPSLIHVHYVAGDPRTSWGEDDWRWYHHVFTAAERERCPVIENVNIPVPPYESDAVRCYVYVSEFVAQRFAARSGRNVVIHPGSDTSFFSPRIEPPDDCVGMVYRLESDKLGPGAIEPFLELGRRRPGTRGLVIGGGAWRQPFEQAVRRAGLHDTITFPGYVPYDDLPEWYGRMAVVVAPVVRESFGQVVPFAMSMGLPVVAYDVGALPEIIGDNDLLVEPGDAAAMAELVAALLDDRPRRLDIGRRNRARAIERFSLPTMIDSYAALYEELVAGQ